MANQEPSVEPLLHGPSRASAAPSTLYLRETLRNPGWESIPARVGKDEKGAAKDRCS